MNRRSQAGWAGAVALLLIAAVLAGLVVVLWEPIKRRIHVATGRPAPEAGRERRLPERAISRRPARLPDEKEGRAESRLPTGPEATERFPLPAGPDPLEAANEALKTLDFKLSAAMAKEFIAAEDPAVSGRALALSKKARVFGQVTANIKPNPEAAGRLVILKRRDREDVEAVLEGETERAYKIAKGTVRAEILKSQVVSIVPVSEDEQRSRLRAAFAEVEKKKLAGKPGGVTYFQLASCAYKDGLKEEALDYLEKAYEAYGPSLPERLRRHEAGTLLYRALWCESTGRTPRARSLSRKLIRVYADLDDLVADAKELMERIEESERASGYKPTVSLIVKSRPGAGSGGQDVSPESEEIALKFDDVRSDARGNEKLVGEINRLFDKGIEHYVAGRPGMPDSNRHLKQAADHFDKVSALCERALRNDPGNRQLQSRAAEARRYRYHAKKMRTLDLFGG